MAKSQLTNEEKNDIILMHKGESVGLYSIREIARLFNRDKGTIRYVINQYQTRGTVKRLIKLDSLDKQRIRRLVSRKPHITGIKIKTKLHLQVSIHTIYTYLAKRGYQYGKSKKTPNWTCKH